MDLGLYSASHRLVNTSLLPIVSDKFFFCSKHFRQQIHMLMSNYEHVDWQAFVTQLLCSCSVYMLGLFSNVHYNIQAQIKCLAK